LNYVLQFLKKVNSVCVGDALAARNSSVPTASLQCFSFTPAKMDSPTQHLLQRGSMSLPQRCRAKIL